MNNKTLAVAFLALGLALVSNLKADKDSHKVMFVNYDFMTSNINKWASDLVKDFEDKKEKEVAVVEKTKAILEKAVKEAQEKERIASEKGKAEARSKIVRLEADAQSAEKAAKYELQTAMERLQMEMDKRLLKEIETNSKKNDVGLVLGHMQNGVVRVLYVEDDFDMSKSVLKELEKKYGKKEDKKDK